MVSGLAGEFPTISDDYTGRRHRYGYFDTVRCVSRDIMSDGLAKHE